MLILFVPVPLPYLTPIDCVVVFVCWLVLRLFVLLLKGVAHAMFGIEILGHLCHQRLVCTPSTLSRLLHCSPRTVPLPPTLRVLTALWNAVCVVAGSTIIATVLSFTQTRWSKFAFNRMLV